ncbi:TfoX/Sxy family protein [Capnocytophaga sp.]|uniref:TfoX/Sxy family protein n=1 Tax=Capnocytophaga sp. TaxID=44737 RepID=UPI0026DBD574|nr:TfoX/Sxy family protein [Capnocytophaga sp.]MDO5106252.1 TfoX/Sxy family protein [Capnocytophaga sp.]
MAHNENLANRVREFLAEIPDIEVEEKKMFGGLAFLVNEKMCVNVSGELLMCRFDAALTDELAEKQGFLPCVMKNKELKGYCYVEEIGYKSPENFAFWLNLCLDFNKKAKKSRK